MHLKHLGHSKHSNKVAIIILVAIPPIENVKQKSKKNPLPQFHFWSLIDQAGSLTLLLEQVISVDVTSINFLLRKDS